MSELEKAITERCNWLGITATDAFVNAVVERVEQDTDNLWNEFDVIIGIRNTINELVEKM